MAYNSKNKLKRMYFIQEYFLQQAEVGLNKKKIYENLTLIFTMSLGTMNNYLNANVRKQIRELGIKEECELYAKRLTRLLNNQTKKQLNND